METDAMDMDILVDHDETRQATFDEQHQRMEIIADDIKKSNKSNNTKFGLRLLPSLLMSLLIAVLIILFVMLPSNVIHTHSGNTTNFNETAIPRFDNITQEMEAAQNHTVTREEKLNLEELLLDQSFNVWKIQGLYDALFQETGEILIHVFPVVGYEFPAQVKLKWERWSNELHFNLSFKFNGSQSMPQMEESPLVAYIFEDRSRNETKRDLIVFGELYIHSITPTFYNSNLGYYHTTSLKKLKAERGRYFIDDVTYIKIVLEDPQHMTKSVQSYNGTLSWTMGDYLLRRQMEKERFRQYEYSVPFYNEKPGYRMRLTADTWSKLNPHSCDDPDGIIVMLRILPGKWDQSLADKKFFRIEIIIEDQSSNTVKHHITRLSNKMVEKNGDYYMGFIPHYEIIDGVHLVNDSLSIKAVVKNLHHYSYISY